MTVLLHLEAIIQRNFNCNESLIEITCDIHTGTSPVAFPITTVKRLPAELKAPGLLDNMIKKYDTIRAEHKLNNSTCSIVCKRIFGTSCLKDCTTSKERLCCISKEWFCCIKRLVEWNEHESCIFFGASILSARWTQLKIIETTYILVNHMCCRFDDLPRDL